VTVTAVPRIQSTKLHGGTCSTQYLVAKQIHNTNRHNLNSTAAILCNSNNFYWNICASIKVCFRAYGADKMFNQELFYRKQLKKEKRSKRTEMSVPSCRVSHITLTQLRPSIHWLHNKLHRGGIAHLKKIPIENIHVLLAQLIQIIICMSFLWDQNEKCHSWD